MALKYVAVRLNVDEREENEAYMVRLEAAALPVEP
jgi:hypothetical protein